MRLSEMRETMEYLRDNAFALNRNEMPNSPEGAACPREQSSTHTHNGEEEPASREREKKLELWMEDVKAFIRNIDVSKL
ncbi:MAG TPA: hypothetical protein PLM79_17770 [Syntrophobacteraceae bacterium]|nr:hypothetical protein [Syntrophobacteraceae bacterium]